jgi:hypothetical protein
MRDCLLSAKANYEQQIEYIDRCLKFLEDHPEMELIMDAQNALMQAPYAVGVR